MNKKRKIWS